MTAAKHRHWFSALWSHFGSYGPQDVHIHPCISGEPGDCQRVIIGPGRDCAGEDGHRRMTLTEEGPSELAWEKAMNARTMTKECQEKDSS